MLHLKSQKYEKYVEEQGKMGHSYNLIKIIIIIITIN